MCRLLGVSASRSPCVRLRLDAGHPAPRPAAAHLEPRGPGHIGRAPGAPPCDVAGGDRPWRARRRRHARGAQRPRGRLAGLRAARPRGGAADGARHNRAHLLDDQGRRERGGHAAGRRGPPQARRSRLEVPARAREAVGVDRRHGREAREHPREDARSQSSTSSRTHPASSTGSATTGSRRSTSVHPCTTRRRTPASSRPCRNCRSRSSQAPGMPTASTSTCWARWSSACRASRSTASSPSGSPVP